MSGSVSSSLFTRLRDRLERNLVAASGGNRANPASFTRAPKLPSQPILLRHIACGKDRPDV